ncbi:MAG: hypothetical protein LW854_16780 [Rubrivivax sp.]|nr:hypothetical protein [Rubrivivax sp.]
MSTPIEPSAKPRTRLRALQRDDHAAVTALFQRYRWPVVRSRAGWDWALFDSPAHEATDADAGWVLEHGSDVVGFLGNLPVLCRHDGAPVWGATCTTYLVDDAHRAHSTRLMRAFAAQPGAAFIYSATANAHSAPVYKGFRFQRAPVPEANQRLRWLAHEGVAARALATRLGLGAAAPVAQAVGSLWARTSRWLKSPPASGGLSVERLSAADLALPRGSPWPQAWNAWAKALWSRQGLWVDRSAATMSWRLSDPDLSDDLALWALRDGQGRMLGMAMARKLGAQGNAIPRAELMDWALLNTAPAEAAPLLMHTVQTWASSWRMAFVDAKRWTNGSAQQLATLSPRIDRLPEDSVWLMVNHRPGIPELPDWPNWDMTGADSDDWFCTQHLVAKSDAKPWLRAPSVAPLHRPPVGADSASDSASTSSAADSTTEGSKRSMSTL